MTFLIVALGLASAAGAAWAATRIAVAAGRWHVLSLAACGFVVGLLVYCGVLQFQVLYVHPAKVIATAVGPEAIFLVFTALAAISAIGVPAALFRAWAALAPASERPAGRFKTAGLALLFSFSVTVLAAPFLIHNQITIERSIRANEAEISAFTTSYKNGLEKLTELGALSRIEVGAEAVTHYIGEPLYKVGERGLAEYARAAMIYHTHVLGKDRMPVVLRDSATDTKIGTFRMDDVFVIHTAAIPPQAATR